MPAYLCSCRPGPTDLTAPTRVPQYADLSSSHAWDGLPHCGRAASRIRTRTTTNHGTRTTAGRLVELDSSHFGIRLIPKQAKASTSSRPTGRADSPARGVPRKLAGRSPGAASRHPSGTLLCLHVTKTGTLRRREFFQEVAKVVTFQLWDG